MSTPANRTLTLSDRWERYWYLDDVEMSLDALPRAQRKEILRDLKANLADAAMDVGMTQAIRDLGTPRALARQYQESEPRLHPTWGIGLTSAAVMFGVVVAFTMLYWLGATDALLQQGEGTMSTHVFGIPAQIWVDSGSIRSEIGIEGAGYIPWLHLTLIALAFCCGSRIWRLWRHTTVSG